METLDLKGAKKMYLWTNKSVNESYMAFFIRRLLYRKIIFSYWFTL